MLHQDAKLVVAVILMCNQLKCTLDAGGNLGDVIRENRKKKSALEISDLAQILMQVSQGLKYIHAQGLVHLDIKPGEHYTYESFIGTLL